MSSSTWTNRFLSFSVCLFNSFSVKFEANERRGNVSVSSLERKANQFRNDSKDTWKRNVCRLETMFELVRRVSRENSSVKMSTFAEGMFSVRSNRRRKKHELCICEDRWWSLSPCELKKRPSKELICRENLVKDVELNKFRPSDCWSNVLIESERRKNARRISFCRDEGKLAEKTKRKRFGRPSTVEEERKTTKLRKKNEEWTNKFVYFLMHRDSLIYSIVVAISRRKI